jgi:polysaccharide biosynthesis transport protein
MQRRPMTDMKDYMGLVSRRWAWIAVPAFAAMFLTLVASAYLPKAYRSETTILVDPSKVPDSIVKMSQSNDVVERLQTISQQVMSRTQLQKLIEQFGLYKNEKNASTEDLVNLMRENIQLEQVSDTRVKSLDLAAFKISFTGASPAVAQGVTRQLASLYIEENLKVKEAQAEGTREFVDKELERARQSLQEQEAKIKEFKAKHMGSLPEQTQANLQLIAQLQNALQTNNDALSRAQQNRAYLHSLSESIKTAPASTPDEQQLRQKNAELLAAEQKYKPEHPDVQRLRREVAALRAQVAAAGGGAEQQGSVAKSQMTALDQEISLRTKRSAELETQVRGMQARMAASPLLEQEWAEINRDYQVQSQNYQTLLQKRNASSMVVQVERDAKGEQFRVLDPASLPTKPTKPNMLQVNLSGIAMGVALGLGLAFFKEMKDSAIHSESDIRYYVPTNLLGCMPEIATTASLQLERRQKMKVWSISGASVAAAMAVIGFLVYRGRLDFMNWF